MKKFLLATALVIASASAMADRVVTGETVRADNQGLGYSSKDRSGACISAKRNAADKRRYDEQIERYSKCDCDEYKDSIGDTLAKSTCTVEATFVEKH